MCPDIEAFAPLIQATFGAGEVVDDDEFEPLPEELRPTDLRVRLADRSLRQTNPVLGVVAQLLDLAGRRLTASDVLDLADREPVRRRFRLDDEDLARHPRLGRRQRHPLGPRRRAPRALTSSRTSPPAPGGRASTACSSASTMTEEGHRLFEGVLPVDDVESLAIDLAGRIAELVDRAAGRGRRLRTPPSRSASGRQAIADRRRRPHRDLASATPGSARSCERILGDVVSEAAGSDAPSSPCSRSARCSPSGCRAARRARTSAPAT